MFCTAIDEISINVDICQSVHLSGLCVSITGQADAIKRRCIIKRGINKLYVVHGIVKRYVDEKELVATNMCSVDMYAFAFLLNLWK